MTTNTPTYAFPYPDPGDALANGDDTIKALAQRVELVLGAGDQPHTYLAAAQTINASTTANMGSLLIPQTYRRRTVHLALYGILSVATAVVANLQPNWADARMVDPGVALRQQLAANGSGQVLYWAFGLAAGAAATTQFNLQLGAGANLTSARLAAHIS